MGRVPFQVLVLPYRRLSAKLEIAIFHRRDLNLWQFISGGGEHQESPGAAACREGFEEAAIPTGSDYTKLDSSCTVPAAWFSAWKDWPTELLVVVEHAFAVEVHAHEFQLSDEHDEVRWVRYDEAQQQLAFDSNKCALWELHERIFPSVRGSGVLTHDASCRCTGAV